MAPISNHITSLDMEPESANEIELPAVSLLANNMSGNPPGTSIITANNLPMANSSPSIAAPNRAPSNPFNNPLAVNNQPIIPFGVPSNMPTVPVNSAMPFGFGANKPDAPFAINGPMMGNLPFNIGNLPSMAGGMPMNLGNLMGLSGSTNVGFGQQGLMANMLGGANQEELKKMAYKMKPMSSWSFQDWRNFLRNYFRERFSRNWTKTVFVFSMYYALMCNWIN